MNCCYLSHSSLTSYNFLPAFVISRTFQGHCMAVWVWIEVISYINQQSFLSLDCSFVTFIRQNKWVVCISTYHKQQTSNLFTSLFWVSDEIVSSLYDPTKIKQRSVISSFSELQEEDEEWENKREGVYDFLLRSGIWLLICYRLYSLVKNVSEYINQRL